MMVNGDDRTGMAGYSARFVAYLAGISAIVAAIPFLTHMAGFPVLDEDSGLVASTSVTTLNFVLIALVFAARREIGERLLPKDVNGSEGRPDRSFWGVRIPTILTVSCAASFVGYMPLVNLGRSIHEISSDPIPWYLAVSVQLTYIVAFVAPVLALSVLFVVDFSANASSLSALAENGDAKEAGAVGQDQPQPGPKTDIGGQAVAGGDPKEIGPQ